MRKPGLSEVLKNENISIIVNTPSETYGSFRDGFSIREIAVRRDIPLITNIKFGVALINALTSKITPHYREIGEYVKN